MIVQYPAQYRKLHTWTVILLTLFVLSILTNAQAITAQVASGQGTLGLLRQPEHQRREMRIHPASK